MIPEKFADFIIAVTGNRIECELREVGTCSVLRVWSFEGARPRLAPVPCNSDYKNNPQGFEGIIFLCVFYSQLSPFCGILCKEKMKESSSAMKKIIVINTGGTIAMSEDRSTGNVTPTSTNPLTNSDTIFAPIASVVVEDLFNLPSPHMTEEKMWRRKVK